MEPSQIIWIIGSVLSALLLFKFLKSSLFPWLVVLALGAFTFPYWQPRWQAFKESEMYASIGIPVLVERAKEALKLGDAGTASTDMEVE